MLSKNIIESTIQTVQKRSLPEGGFTLYNGGSFRADAAAWAVLALEAFDGSHDLAIRACQRLARSQLPDGRISVVEGHSESYWPTSLALLVWKKIPGFKK